jgi:hypothetical protein
MHKSLNYACLLLIVLYLPCHLSAQNISSDSTQVIDLPQHLFESVDRKADKLQSLLSSTSQKYISKLARREKILQRKLAKKDPQKALDIFGDVDSKYKSILSGLTDSIKSNNPLSNVYSGHLDSLSTSLKFLGAGKSFLQSNEVTKVIERYKVAQLDLNKMHSIQNALKQRQDDLVSKLSSLGFSKELLKYKREFYYYRAQLEEYKNIFSHPNKLEARILEAVSRIPQFKKFFAKYSQLGQLFRLPDSDNQDLFSLQGLQTRANITQDMQNRFGSRTNVSQAMSSGFSNAESEVSQLKDKISRLGNSGSTEEMPNFKPNTEKTKRFLRRLEFGTNFQSSRSSAFIPTTTDIGLSVGYKLNPRSIAGIGASYKMGWGRDIRHISISHEGVGLRSFIELKIKGGFWLSGGGEMNYHSSFRGFEQLKDYSIWQKSVLAGISKKYQVKQKAKGNMQLLYDFLYKNHKPETQPLIFRVGYNLK